jgi:hypothetical protein
MRLLPAKTTLYATVATRLGGLRDELVSCTFEEPRLYVRDKPIGLTPPVNGVPKYGSVLEMLADGWKLLGPPVLRFETQYEFWLTKEMCYFP